MEKLRVLPEGEILEELQFLPGWEYKSGRLVKTYKFKKFVDVIAFIDLLAAYFEKVDHHADMEIEHRKITFKLWRFDIGMKVTSLDFIVAHKIEELSEKFPKELDNKNPQHSH